MSTVMNRKYLDAYYFVIEWSKKYNLQMTKQMDILLQSLKINQMNCAIISQEVQIITVQTNLENQHLVT